MSDLVVTCPKDFWDEWIAEGDPAGEPWSGQEWGWRMDIPYRPAIGVGDRLYVVARGLLRGFAPVTAVRGLSFDPHHGAEGSAGVWHDSPKTWREGALVEGADAWMICREGDAVAVTISDHIRGFQGYRHRWWAREIERPFPEWRTAEAWAVA